MTTCNALLKGSLLILTLVLGACGHHGAHKPSEAGKGKGSSQQSDDGDGPPERDIDVTHIPNATPRTEPLSRYGNPSKYEVFGVHYHTMPHSRGYAAEGTASWYGRKFHGQRTSSGEPYDMYGMTAAHRSLPLPTYAKVTNLHNGKEVIVKINDRGPFVKGRLIDLSYAAAKKLGIHAQGTGKVRITAIDPVAWHKQQKQATKLAQAGKKKAVKAKSTQIAKANKQIYVQLGAFNKKDSAQKLADKASTLTQALNNVDVKVMPSKLANKESFKVRVGPLKDEKQAQSIQKKLIALNKTSAPKVVYE